MSKNTSIRKSLALVQQESTTMPSSFVTCTPSATFDIERVCRILVRFALLTEEIDHEQASSLSTQEK